jgi:riboflavin kinase/FMN adenylyltransferase
MQILRGDLSAFEGETVLTIGKYDGLHIAHQSLIRHIRERAARRGARSGMVTFDPHPAAVLSSSGPPPLLTTIPEKIALLEGMGLDVLVLLPFTRETMQTRAADYLEFLASGLHPRELWVGEDFALGYKREGNVAFIRQWAEPRGIEVFTIPLVEMDGAVVSGSRVRALLDEGAVEEAARLLGRLPSVTGVVVEGDKRGRTIGFPTANLIPDPGRAIPANGVYATRALLADGDGVPSVTNVGTRPTFEGSRRQVETHLLDWSGDLYGQEITVQFLHRLREERKFAGIEALVAQIRADAEQARALLVPSASG